MVKWFRFQVGTELRVMITRKYIDEIGFLIVGAAIEVHKVLGPGLLESTYSVCFEHELKFRGLNFEREKRVSLRYKGVHVDSLLKCDFLIENLIVVELKSVQEIIPVHQAQLLTYMKILEKPKGILINFNCGNIYRQGQKTMVNEIYRSLPY